MQAIAWSTEQVLCVRASKSIHERIEEKLEFDYLEISKLSRQGKT